MATKPMAWQEQGPVILPGEFLGEEGTSLNSPLDDREAPRATPEEDLDDREPGAEAREPHDHRPVTVDVTQMRNEKSDDMKQSFLREAREMMTELEEISPEVLLAKEEPNNDLGEDVFPSPPTTHVSAGECSEREGLSSLEGEVAEWISDAEVILDPSEGLAHLDLQSSEEWTMTTQAVFQNKISQTKPAAEEDVVIQPSPFDIHTSDDANSPPFVDESEEEEGFDGSCEVSQPSSHAVSDPDSVLHAGRSAGQRGELLPQGPCELTPRGENQEAAQQVSGQGSPPLSAVAMEPSNQGREASEGCGCVVAMRERCSRVGKKTEGENEQAGAEEEQKDNRKNQPKERSSGEERVKYQEPAQKQESKTGKQGCGVSSEERRDTRMRNNMYEDQRRNSGGSADLYITLEGSPNSTDSPAETPIEREIRRAIQREQSLRRSRGLPNPRTAPEYIEIPSRKGILSQSLTTKWSQNKDREFAGKMMQQEIHEETRREQDLVKIGKIPGFYDKGTVRQIKERKQLFEAFQTSLESTKSKMSSLKSTEDLTLESLDDVKSQASMFGSLPVERKPMLLNPNHPKEAVEHASLQGTDLSDGKDCQVIVLEKRPTSFTQKQNRVRVETDLRSGHPHNSSYQARTEEPIEEEEEEQEDTSTENPFFKLRSSTNLKKVKQDILETKERERELRKMRSSLYGGINGVASSSQREQSPPDVPESSFKEGRGSSAARQSGSRLSAWPPVQAEEQKITRPEVLLSPWTPRQKTPLVQLWESGLVNGHSLEDD